jgi:hypothetical protein
MAKKTKHNINEESANEVSANGNIKRSNNNQDTHQQQEKHPNSLARKSSSAAQLQPEATSNTRRTSSLNELSTSKKAQQSTDTRPSRRRGRKAGDVELTRDPTISVVVKYQLGQHELKKFKQCFNQIDLE